MCRSEQGVTATIALTPSTEENGCVEVLPMSHNNGQVNHIKCDDGTSMLSGEKIENTEVSCSVADDDLVVAIGCQPPTN